MSKKLDNYKEAALTFANQVRVGLGMKALKALPKGVTGDPQYCVLARAFNDGSSVDGDNVEFDNDVKAYIAATAVGQKYDIDNPTPEISLPKAVKSFVRAFDDDKYPELCES